MSLDPARKCIECGGEGGWYNCKTTPAIWSRCPSCYGFGLRSDAADRWFKRSTLAIPVAASALER